MRYEDRAQFIKRENSCIDEVKDTLATGLGLASDRGMVSLPDSGRPLTGADVLNKAEIHGKKGKLTRKARSPIVHLRDANYSAGASGANPDRRHPAYLQPPLPLLSSPTSPLSNVP